MSWSVVCARRAIPNQIECRRRRAAANPRRSRSPTIPVHTSVVTYNCRARSAHDQLRPGSRRNASSVSSCASDSICWPINCSISAGKSVAIVRPVLFALNTNNIRNCRSEYSRQQHCDCCSLIVLTFHECRPPSGLSLHGRRARRQPRNGESGRNSTARPIRLYERSRHCCAVSCEYERVMDVALPQGGSLTAR